MGVFLVSIGAILSTVWYFQGDPTWWIAIVAFSLFYGFIWMMAWILRNNP